MDELRRMAWPASFTKSPSGRPSLILKLKVPSSYLSTLCTTSITPEEFAFDKAPFKAPVAKMTNRTLHDGSSLSNLPKAPVSWPDFYTQKLSTRTTMESPPQPDQQENICVHEARKVEKTSRDLVRPKDESIPPLRTINESLEGLEYPEGSLVKISAQFNQSLGSSRATIKQPIKPVIKPELAAKLLPQSPSTNFQRIAPRITSLRTVPVTDRILRSQSKAELSSKSELNASYRAKVEAEIQRGAQTTEDQEFGKTLEMGAGVGAWRQGEEKLLVVGGETAGEKKRKGWIRKNISIGGDGEMVASWTKARVVLETD